MRQRGWGGAGVYEVWSSLPSRAKRAGLVLLAILFLLVLARETMIGFYRVHGRSMAPTLHPGDYVLADKTAFGNGFLALLLSREVMPSRGEIVVFALRPERGRYLIKRVVALPGDTLAMRGGRLYVNHQPLAEPYLNPAADTLDRSDAPGSWHFSYLPPQKQTRRYHPTGRNWGPLIVPDSAFFVLGDNRDASGDSRSFGFVYVGELVARPIAFLK